MNRPSEKLLKDMSTEELSTESEWHAYEAAELFEEVKHLREFAVTLNPAEAESALRTAMTKELEAEAHMHQSNLLDSLHAARLSKHGVGVVMHTAAA